MSQRPDGTVFPPTPEILAMCDVLDESISRYLKARDTVPTMTRGVYEADVEAYLMILLILRNIEGVVELARRDLVLVPPAMVISRSAFEVGIKVRWMMDPEDPFEREIRWLALAQDRVKSYKRMGKIAEPVSQSYANDLYNSADIADAFFNAIKDELNKKFPGKYQSMKQAPNLRAMLDSLKEENLYIWYIRTSQYTHGSQIATTLYRKGYGIDKEYGEFVSHDNWFECFYLCWLAFDNAGMIFLERSGGKSHQFISKSFRSKFDQALTRISDKNG